MLAGGYIHGTGGYVYAVQCRASWSLVRPLSLWRHHSAHLHHWVRPLYLFLSPSASLLEPSILSTPPANCVSSFILQVLLCISLCLSLWLSILVSWHKQLVLDRLLFAAVVPFLSPCWLYPVLRWFQQSAWTNEGDGGTREKRADILCQTSEALLQAFQEVGNMIFSSVLLLLCWCLELLIRNLLVLCVMAVI